MGNQMSWVRAIAETLSRWACSVTRWLSSSLPKAQILVYESGRGRWDYHTNNMLVITVRHNKYFTCLMCLIVDTGDLYKWIFRQADVSNCADTCDLCNWKNVAGFMISRMGFAINIILIPFYGILGRRDSPCSFTSSLVVSSIHLVQHLLSGLMANSRVVTHCASYPRQPITRGDRLY